MPRIDPRVIERYDRLYTVPEVAEYFEVTPNTVRVWLNDGTLKGFKIGKGYYWRIPESELKKFATKRHGDTNEVA